MRWCSGVRRRRRRRRRRSLLRIVHARGVIPNEMGPTSWRRRRRIPNEMGPTSWRRRRRLIQNRTRAGARFLTR